MSLIADGKLLGKLNLVDLVVIICIAIGLYVIFSPIFLLPEETVYVRVSFGETSKWIANVMGVGDQDIPLGRLDVNVAVAELVSLEKTQLSEDSYLVEGVVKLRAYRRKNDLNFKDKKLLLLGNLTFETQRYKLDGRILAIAKDPDAVMEKNNFVFSPFFNTEPDNPTNIKEKGYARVDFGDLSPWVSHLIAKGDTENLFGTGADGEVYVKIVDLKKQKVSNNNTNVQAIFLFYANVSRTSFEFKNKRLAFGDEFEFDPGKYKITGTVLALSTAPEDLVFAPEPETEKFTIGEEAGVFEQKVERVQIKMSNVSPEIADSITIGLTQTDEDNFVWAELVGKQVERHKEVQIVEGAYVTLIHPTNEDVTLTLILKTKKYNWGSVFNEQLIQIDKDLAVNLPPLVITGKVIHIEDTDGTW